jgi:hypothetical protein
MKDFDIAKYLKENKLGSYGILNHYVDLKPLKEEDENKKVTEGISETDQDYLSLKTCIENLSKRYDEETIISAVNKILNISDISPMFEEETDSEKEAKWTIARHK